MTRVRLRRVFWVGAAAILVAAALVALVALLSGSFSDTDEQILWTLGVLFFTGSTTLAGVALLDRGVHRLLGWAIVVVAPVTFVLLVVWGWSRFDGGVTLVDLVGSASLLLAGGLVVATGRLVLRNPAVRPIALATECFVWFATGLTVFYIWSGVDPGALGARLVGCSLILAALGWFVVPVLQRYSAVQPEHVPRTERVLAALEGVELVITTSTDEGVAVGEIRVGAGEWLVLRSRSA